MKAIDLLLKDIVPPDLWDEQRKWDQPSVVRLMADVARKYPEQYGSIAKRLSDVGRHAAYRMGVTLTLSDMKPVLDRDRILAEMDQEIAQAQATSTTPLEFRKQRLSIWDKYNSRLNKETLAASKALGNNLSNTVLSGARGSPSQLMAMVTTPAMYADYKDEPVEMFVRHSFGEGLRPAEYLAATFGVRKSVVSTKAMTAKGGDFSKLMAQTAAPLTVTEHDCGTTNGLEYSTDGTDSLHRVLTKPVGQVPAGTPIDKSLLLKFRKEGVKSVFTRSPLTCQSEHGLCAKCLGLLPEGHFAHKGYHAGITAANALGEPVTQASLNTKHLSGMFGGKKQFSGFPVLSNLVQSPEVFPDRSTVAEQPGRVEHIEKATQGGYNIRVGDREHYVLPGLEPTVKVGDEVEPGDPMSEGVVDSADVVRLRGLGEGRKYLADRLNQVFAESSWGKPSRTNVELASRAMLNHVVITPSEGFMGHLPDDTVDYQGLAANYSPPKEAQSVHPDRATGQYLQAPYLHYTIGTQLTPRMVKEIKSAGHNQVMVSAEPPAFVPQTVRLRAAAHATDDWLARLNSSYLTSGLEHSAVRAQDTNVEENYHFAPRLMAGAGFGKKIEETGKF